MNLAMSRLSASHMLAPYLPSFQTTLMTVHTQECIQHTRMHVRARTHTNTQTHFTTNAFFPYTLYLEGISSLFKNAGMLPCQEAIPGTSFSMVSEVTQSMVTVLKITTVLLTESSNHGSGRSESQPQVSALPFYPSPHWESQ